MYQDLNLYNAPMHDISNRTQRVYWPQNYWLSDSVEVYTENKQSDQRQRSGITDYSVFSLRTIQ